jgi:hypothetical protein
MSAQIVSKPHIDLLVSAGLLLPKNAPLRWNTDPSSHPMRERDLQYGNADDIGGMLWAENIASVGHRYPDESITCVPGAAHFEGGQALPYRYQAIPGTINPLTVLSSIACYEYHSNEHPGWQLSEARRFCFALREVSIRALPGYDSQPWGFNDRDYFLKLLTGR